MPKTIDLWITKDGPCFIIQLTRPLYYHVGTDTFVYTLDVEEFNRHKTEVFPTVSYEMYAEELWDIARDRYFDAKKQDLIDDITKKFGGE